MASWDAQSQEHKDKSKKARSKICKYFFEFLSVFWYFFSPAAVYTTDFSCYWRDMSLAAQVLIGWLLPSVQQQQANITPFHTEQT